MGGHVADAPQLRLKHSENRWSHKHGDIGAEQKWMAYRAGVDSPDWGQRWREAHNPDRLPFASIREPALSKNQNDRRPGSASWSSPPFTGVVLYAREPAITGTEEQ